VQCGIILPATHQLEREFFMTALRLLPALLIAAVFCLATPGAWAQTAPSGASTTTTSGTETPAEKKKAEEKAAKAQEEQEKKSKEEAAKEAKEGKTAPPAASTSTTPETKTATESKTKTSKTASGNSGGFASEAEAKASCPMDTVVWENTSSKVYHAANSKYYGKTKHGAYACSKAAGAAGFKAASN